MSQAIGARAELVGPQVRILLAAYQKKTNSSFAKPSIALARLDDTPWTALRAT